MVIPKFMPGDKVRLIEKKHYGNDRPGLRKGAVYTIENKPKYFKTFNQYAYEVEESVYLLIEDEIELEEFSLSEEYVTSARLDFVIPITDKKEAHRIAHAEVEKALQEHEETRREYEKLASRTYEDWTPEEIRTAQDAIAKLVHYVTVNGGDISWAKDNRGNIWCRYRRDLYEPFNKANKGMAKKMSEDAYNEWIGKYVSLCHAMRFPLPEFIRFKNVKQ